MSLSDPPSQCARHGDGVDGPVGECCCECRSCRRKAPPQPPATYADRPTDWNRLLSAADLRRPICRRPTRFGIRHFTPTGARPGRPFGTKLRRFASRPHRIGVDRSSSGSLLRGRNPRSPRPIPKRGASAWGRSSLPSCSSSVLLGGLLLARRNLKLGRSDRNGAFRIASVFVAVHMLGWRSGAPILADVARRSSPSSERWRRLCSKASCCGFSILALEPYVRKRWPETIISWTRVLAGRFRDPLVGRDILLGCLLGVGTVALIDAPRLLGIDPRRPDGCQSVEPQRHRPASSVSSWTVRFTRWCSRCSSWFSCFSSASCCVGWRWPPRRSWSCSVSSDGLRPPLARSRECPGLRGGRPASPSRDSVCSPPRCSSRRQRALDFCATADLFSWYGAGTILAVLWIVAIAGYGFHTAFAGRPLFGEKFLQE